MKKFDLIAHPAYFNTALRRAAELGHQEVLNGKPEERSTQKVLEQICTTWYIGQAKAIKAAYHGGRWNARLIKKEL